jgi:hypothetical protein
MTTLNVTKVTSKNYNSQSVTNYFEKGISKEEIKIFLNGNRDIKILQTEEKKIDLIGKSNVIVRFEGYLEFLTNVNSL